MEFLIWLLIFATLLLLLWRFLRQDIKPIEQPFRSSLAKGMMPFACESCNGDGAFNLTMPQKRLTIGDQLAMANQITCGCCNGLGVHWIKIGGKYRCIRYEAPSGNQSRAGKNAG